MDDRFDYGEIRVYAIGLVNGLEITVIYTDRDGDERHLISAWRSNPMKDATTVAEPRSGARPALTGKL
ncbi:MAG: BrnT family toxin [Chromatiales bacterium]|nr:BrnT family toxin [Chromatiales bacterium]